MALGDIKIYDEAEFGYPGEVEYVCSSNNIYAGDPIIKALGNTSGYYVDIAGDGSPLVGTDYMAGIAATTQLTTGGKVSVTKLANGVTYICAPTVEGTWDTQAKYNALVGSRVLFGLSAGTYTIGATDALGNGLVVMPLNIAKYPRKVRFAIRRAVDYLA